MPAKFIVPGGDAANEKNIRAGLKKLFQAADGHLQYTSYLESYELSHMYVVFIDIDASINYERSSQILGRCDLVGRDRALTATKLGESMCC